MNVCVFTKSLLKGGAEKQSVLLAASLSRYYKTFLVVLFDSQNNIYAELLKESRVRVIILRGNIIKKMLRMIRLFKKENIKILFCYLLSTNIIGVITGRLAGVKYIIGGIRNVYHPLLKEAALKYIHNHLTDYSILNNYSAQKYLSEKKFNAHKMVVIPNGIRIKEKSILRNYGNKATIVTVARFVPQKDYITALKAIEYLAKILLRGSNIEVHYNIIGYGKLKNEIREYVNYLNMENVVNILDDKDLNEIYTNADIYLCSSVYEGTSNSIMEAMNYSLPVVATNVGDNNQLVQNMKNGFLCSAGDYKNMASSLHFLVTNEDYRVIMGKYSYQILKDHYSLEVFRKRYQDFIKSLIPKYYYHKNNPLVYDANISNK